MHTRQTMRGRALVLAVVSASLGLAAQGAFAQAQAYTNQPVELFAGPSDDYPVVAQLAPSQPVAVMGCVSDYSWCDVALPNLRGWVYADYLNYPYDGSYVPIENYGAAIGLPIVTFTLGEYWDSFYRGRPWYNERARWEHILPEGRGGRPPRPLGGHLAPPQGPRGPVGEGNRPHAPEFRGAPHEGGRPPMGGAGRPPVGQPPHEGGRPPMNGAPHQPPRPSFNAAPHQAAPPVARPPTPAVTRQAAPPHFARPAAPPGGGFHPPAGGGPRPEGPRPAPQGGHPAEHAGGHEEHPH